jgi:hypothetical protein
MIIVDLNKSYQNKSTHIVAEKVVLLWSQKSCFFSVAPQSHLGQAKSGQIDLSYLTCQGLPESPSYDPSWSSVWK